MGRAAWLMDGTHALAARVEGEFAQTWHLLCLCLHINARFAGDNAQGRLGRIAQNGPWCVHDIGGQYPGVVAQASGHEELTYIGVHRWRYGLSMLQQLTLRSIADTRDRALPAREPELTHGHLVLREGASLVRTNDGGTSQGFDG